MKILISILLISLCMFDAVGISNEILSDRTSSNRSFSKDEYQNQKEISVSKATQDQCSEKKPNCNECTLPLHGCHLSHCGFTLPTTVFLNKPITNSFLVFSPPNNLISISPSPQEKPPRV